MDNTPTPYGQEQAQEQPPRIYLVTDGLKSPHTKEAYAIGFNQFLKITIKNDDLRALLDTKPSVIESKITRAGSKSTNNDNNNETQQTPWQIENRGWTKEEAEDFVNEIGAIGRERNRSNEEQDESKK